MVVDLDGASLPFEEIDRLEQQINNLVTEQKEKEKIMCEIQVFRWRGHNSRP